MLQTVGSTEGPETDAVVIFLADLRKIFLVGRVNDIGAAVGIEFPWIPEFRRLFGNDRKAVDSRHQNNLGPRQKKRI